jgi:hypothetical protein
MRDLSTFHQLDQVKSSYFNHLIFKRIQNIYIKKKNIDNLQLQEVNGQNTYLSQYILKTKTLIRVSRNFVTDKH